jgi:drug/metabolite transporter (DMT)-like permease
MRKNKRLENCSISPLQPQQQQYSIQNLHLRKRGRHPSMHNSKILPSPSSSPSSSPSNSITYFLASLYVLSGVTQPLLMTLIKAAGIADPRAQLYMFFYYLGPAAVTFSVSTWPTSLSRIGMTALIAGFDLLAQSLNYTGSSLSGPTLFAIIYSSVTIWTAVFSFFVFQRQLTICQWVGIFVVFSGLCLTAFQSTALGQNVLHGSILVLLGSSMHALTYVFSEWLMQEDKVSVPANCAIQGIVSCFSIGIWQIIYTSSHLNELILIPMKNANTSWFYASSLLFLFGLSNFVHALCFFFTLRHFPGGSTSAGVMKGLQAVLVFTMTSIVYCGRIGGPEMCFSTFKLYSLIVVSAGIIMFGKATDGTQRTEIGYEVIRDGPHDIL